MGNTSKKLAAKCALLTREEQKFIANTFRAASKNSDKIREEDLIKLWGPQIDPRLSQFLTNYLFGQPGGTKGQSCDFNRFAELYVYNVRGTTEERLTVVYNSLGKEFTETTELPYQLLREYCESIASTYIRIIKSSAAPCAKHWIEKGFRGKASNVQALGEATASTAGKDVDTPAMSCDSKGLYSWLQSNTLLHQMSELVFHNLYGLDRDYRSNERVDEPSASVFRNPTCSLLPDPTGIESMPDYPAFIDLCHIVWLNSHLPRKHQDKWRFLFSSHIHGESFSTMAGRIQESGPSLLIVEDSSGFIFGGYASESWQICPNFYGDDSSFLFTLAPRMRIYPATNFNNHYQYMNQNTKTLPNGLMMGGQFEFGGIWINADPFGHGFSAESCSTYRGFKRLSKEAEFKIRSLEVWGVGEKPLTVKESMESVTSKRSSVLDTHRSDRQFLNIIGKPQISEGFRGEV
ncbi:TLD domain-containing protein 1 isoform X2 [Hyposmocoma kahamanoa]|uniref:TLD domain-containing protein 1 isoform X2 n=1 Tax=Hyposmocoma kahamanoa TaxID=1477025 RepID=UPI000E6D6F49|nr:TLD domain-containing protein 1 isoform X2 [Hyposmocoma kahamanoa]